MEIRKTFEKPDPSGDGTGDVILMIDAKTDSLATEIYDKLKNLLHSEGWD